MKYYVLLIAFGTVFLLCGCAVPANMVADKAFECGKNGQKMTYLHRVFDGGVMQMECE